MLSWVSIVLYIITNLPKFISIIRDIIDLIKKAPHSREALSLRERLSNAIEQHKKTKDDEAFGKACFGIGCAPQLVKE